MSYCHEIFHSEIFISVSMFLPTCGNIYLCFYVSPYVEIFISVSMSLPTCGNIYLLADLLWIRPPKTSLHGLILGKL